MAIVEAYKNKNPQWWYPLLSLDSDVIKGSVRRLSIRHGAENIKPDARRQNRLDPEDLDSYLKRHPRTQSKGVTNKLYFMDLQTELQNALGRAVIDPITKQPIGNVFFDEDEVTIDDDKLLYQLDKLAKSKLHILDWTKEDAEALIHEMKTYIFGDEASFPTTSMFKVNVEKLIEAAEDAFTHIAGMEREYEEKKRYHKPGNTLPRVNDVTHSAPGRALTEDEKAEKRRKEREGKPLILPEIKEPPKGQPVSAPIYYKK